MGKSANQGEANNCQVHNLDFPTSKPGHCARDFGCQDRCLVSMDGPKTERERQDGSLTEGSLVSRRDH